jgi:hypothetical protein
MKLTNALGLRSAWVCIVVDLPPSIMMGKKKQSVNFKDKVGTF